MANIVQFDPLSEEALSTPIAGLSEAVTKISEILNMNTTSYNGVVMNEVFISSSDRYRIYQVANGKRLWTNTIAPIIRKNGSIINPVNAGFEIDYIGGSIKFETNYRLIETDIVTADFSSLNADSKTINDITSTLTDIQAIVAKNKGYYPDSASLKVAYPTANAGDYAIVGGATDTLWIWDTDSNDWKNTFKTTDLSDYFTKSETNNLLGQKEPNINKHGNALDDDNFYYGGRKSWVDVFLKVRSTLLTGLDDTNKSVITQTDNILSAIGKLQGQINDTLKKADVVNNLTTGGATSVLSAEQGKVLKSSIDVNSSEIGQLTSYLEYMPINGGAFDGNEPSGVTIDGGTY